jgi:hypothetical protein
MNDTAASPAPRKKQPPKPAPAATTGSAPHVDRMLAAFGVLIALSSLGFAGYMVADVDRPPRIAGLEYLSIFARPSRSLAVVDPEPAALPAQETPSRIAQSIDPTPTGSIPAKAAAGRPVDALAAPVGVAPAHAPSFPYKLLYVSNGEALLQTEGGILHVKAGDTLPTLGRINAIEKAGDRWFLTAQNGATLEWPYQRSGAKPNPR